MSVQHEHDNLSIVMSAQHQHDNLSIVISVQHEHDNLILPNRSYVLPVTMRCTPCAAVSQYNLCRREEQTFV